MKDLNETIKDMLKLIPLAAIWLNEPLIVETEDNQLVKAIRITKGMSVRVLHNTLLDVREDAPANATILECIGDVYSIRLELDLVDSTGKEFKLILK